MFRSGLGRHHALADWSQCLLHSTDEQGHPQYLSQESVIESITSSTNRDMTTALFDSWTERYDAWFTTPTGRLVKQYETDLLLDLLTPAPEEHILDAGCGTGIFTREVLIAGASVTGLDLSLPMVHKAVTLLDTGHFAGLQGDICALPFADNSFDKVFSMTAIEFIADASQAIAELNRVARTGGLVVVTTLNSLSPWAERRLQNADNGHTLFQHIHFRSPEEMRALAPSAAVTRTAIHFLKHDPVDQIPSIERKGQHLHPDTGAFLAIQWQKT